VFIFVPYIGAFFYAMCGMENWITPPVDDSSKELPTMNTDQDLDQSQNNLAKSRDGSIMMKSIN